MMSWEVIVLVGPFVTGVRVLVVFGTHIKPVFDWYFDPSWAADVLRP
jgi:hypothetical protein